MRRDVSEYIVQRLGESGLKYAWPLFPLLAEEGPMGQQEAAERLRLTRGTSNLYSHALEGAGLIRRVRVVRGRIGRPKVIWDVDRENNWLLTTVVAAPQMLSFLMTLGGDTVAEWEWDLAELSRRRDLERALREVLSASGRLAERQKARLRLAVAALPALLDERSGRVILSANVPMLNGLDFEAIVKRQLGIPALSAYLGLVFFYGETEYLDPNEESLVVYMDLGIGAVFGQGAVPITQRPQDHPARPSAPGLGHVRVVRDGRRCHCGGLGCLEAYAAGWAMIERLSISEPFGLARLMQMVRNGDAAARQAAEEAMETLGRALAWPINVFGVDRVILTGRLSALGSAVKESLMRGLGATLGEEEMKRIRLTVSDDPSRAVKRGSFLLAKNAFLYPSRFDPPHRLDPRSQHLFSTAVINHAWEGRKRLPPNQRDKTNDE